MAPAHNLVQAEIQFKSGIYLVTVANLPSLTLCVQVESQSDGTRWRGDFTARYLEDITSRTGSFKKYGVFVKMLTSALTEQSDAVFVDLLTYEDLEALRRRRASSASATGDPEQPLADSYVSHEQGQTKRYLILTYAAEFDRVHYPLPLLEEEADVGILKATIRKLREELGEARQAAGLISKVKHQNGLSAVERENKTLRKEKEILTERLQTLENNMGVSTADIKQGQTGKTARVLEKELAVSRRKVVQTEESLKKEQVLSRRRAKEIEQLRREVLELKEEDRRHRTRVRELNLELDQMRRQHRTGRAMAENGPSKGPLSNAANNAISERRRRNSASSSELRNQTTAAQRGRSKTKRSNSVGSNKRKQSPSPSPQARFDPTAYVRDREEKIARRRSRSPAPFTAGTNLRHRSPSPSVYSERSDTSVKSGRSQRSVRSQKSSLNGKQAQRRELQNTSRITKENERSHNRTALPTNFNREESYNSGESNAASVRADSDIEMERLNGEGGFGEVQEPVEISVNGAAEEIADIDSRLHALQNFLRQAK